MNDTQPIEDAVQNWTGAWCNRDASAIMALWDHNDPSSAYLPAEREAPLIGHEAVAGYVRSLCQTFETVRHRPETTITKRLGDDVGLSFYVLDWAVADTRGPIGGRCRVTGLWQKRKDGWKLTQYSEAPLAPLIELRDFYQRVAADGLPS